MGVVLPCKDFGLFSVIHARFALSTRRVDNGKHVFSDPFSGWNTHRRCPVGHPDRFPLLQKGLLAGLTHIMNPPAGPSRMEDLRRTSNQALYRRLKASCWLRRLRESYVVERQSETMRVVIGRADALRAAVLASSGCAVLLLQEAETPSDVYPDRKERPYQRDRWDRAQWARWWMRRSCVGHCRTIGIQLIRRRCAQTVSANELGRCCLRFHRPADSMP